MKAYSFILSVLSILFFSSSIFSNPVLKIQNELYIYDLSPYLSFYKDSKGLLNIDKILEQEKKGSLFNRSDIFQSIRMTDARIWGKFQWENKSSMPNDWVMVFETERLEDVDVYRVVKDKVITSYHYDSDQPFSKRQIQHRKLSFPLSGTDTLQTIYFSAKTTQPLDLPMSLISPLRLAQKNYEEMFLTGLYFGIMLSMIFYNIFIFLATRDKSYLYYIIYISLFTVIQTSVEGLLHQYVFPNSFEFARDLRIYLSSFAITFAVLFAVSLMEIKKYYRKMYYVYVFLIPLSFLPFISQWIYGFKIGVMVQAFTLLFACTLQIVVGFALSFKIKQARYYFAAWFIFLLGLIVLELEIVGMKLPVVKSYQAVQWSSAVEAILLSLALGYRINVMRRSIMEKDNELLNAKFTNLKDKMNPHFVLNTLSIIMAYLKRDVNKANAALNYFTSSYKYLIRHENEHLTSLEDELTFTKDYTSILLIKYSDTLKVNYYISGDLDKILIPFLSLQPIVENAFKHGIRKLENGEIQIKINVSGQTVDIEVRNSSNGSAIKKPFQGTLGAIKRRIEHFFEDAEFSITDDQNETIVKIHYKNIVKEGNLITTYK